MALITVLSLPMVVACSSAESKIPRASQIVPGFSDVQTATDKLPPEVHATFDGVGIADANSRQVGESGGIRYFAGTREDAEICLVAVELPSTPLMMGCTEIAGFRGLRIKATERAQEAWLVVPGKASEALDSADSETWEQVAPNLLVKPSEP
ncbi:hypothetical protein ACX8Z7_00630 [Glutamicibacter endophyticus]